MGSCCVKSTNGTRVHVYTLEQSKESENEACLLDSATESCESLETSDKSVQSTSVSNEEGHGACGLEDEPVSSTTEGSYTLIAAYLNPLERNSVSSSNGEDYMLGLEDKSTAHLPPENSKHEFDRQEPPHAESSMGQVYREHNENWTRQRSLVAESPTVLSSGSYLYQETPKTSRTDGTRGVQYHDNASTLSRVPNQPDERSGVESRPANTDRDQYDYIATRLEALLRETDHLITTKDLFADDTVENGGNASTSSTSGFDESSLNLPSPPGSPPRSKCDSSKEDNEQDGTFDALDTPKFSGDGVLKRYQRFYSVPEHKFRKGNTKGINDETQSEPVPRSRRNTSFMGNYSSYTLSSASVDLPSPLKNEEGQRLIPAFKDNNSRYSWPNSKLPIGGNGQFNENDQWIINEPLGQGACGHCYLGCTTSTDVSTVFCVKKCQYKGEEVKALMLATKENIQQIVTFYGATLYGPDICIFMEFMTGGTVADVINEVGVLDTSVYTDYTVDVLQALEFIHKKGILHNDVKGANVLLNESRIQAKLADFGSATSRDDKDSTSCQADMWLVGCFLLEMINGERPTLVAFAKGNTGNCGRVEEYLSNVRDDDKHVLNACFGANGRRKCTATEILKRFRKYPN